MTASPLRRSLSALVLCGVPLAAQGPALMSGQGLVVERMIQFPATETTPASSDQRAMRHARINHLGEIPDGSHRRYVPDLNGMLYVIAGDTLVRYLDVKTEVGADFISSRGLGGGFGFVTFHPEFVRNGKFYTVHTEAFAALTARTADFAQPGSSIQGVVTEWTAVDPKAATFVGSRREVLRLGFATQIHGIQQIDFNPTARRGDADHGLLYVAVGDGGIGASTEDPQDLRTPFGKLLRIDPAVSPFAYRSGALKEIFAYGMRDPHRFSWDPGGAHRLLLAHIGERQVESLFDVHAGDNLGWSEREGAQRFDRADRCTLKPLPLDDASLGFVYPVAAYDHDKPPGYPCNVDMGRAISGGFVYRGQRIPALRGKYLFADLVDGRVMYVEERELRRGGPRAAIHELAILDASGNETTMPLLANDRRVDLRFGRDASGELYLLSKANGTIWRVTGFREVPHPSPIFPALAPNLVAYYDFEHPDANDPSTERDQGRSGLALRLINGGAEMRIADGAHAASRRAMQLAQRTPLDSGNNDWKAGVFSPDGAKALSAFNAARGATIMGWVKVTGQLPALNSNTSDPNDRYDAVGLAGILEGTSNGHTVRALIELVGGSNDLRLIALARRVDGGRSLAFVASESWEAILPRDEWVFLAATFDFTTGAMALYKNGRALSGTYGSDDDPLGVRAPGPHTTSATDPRGIKIGGSYPQNTLEWNACDCRMDDLMFLDRAITSLEIGQQYRRMIGLPRPSGTRHSR